MHYIALDTCTWIYLANGTEPVKLLDYILEESRKENITILVPEIIVDEWERNKINTVEDVAMKHFKQVLKELDKISHLLGEKGEKPKYSFLINEKDQNEYFDEVIEKIKSKQKDVKAAVKENIRKIDRIFKNHSTVIIKIEDKIKLLAGKHALEKKAPFKNKNSFADALILFSFIDYVTQNKIEGANFVTYNTSDFCEKRESKKYLHPDLEPYFTRSKSKFYKIVGNLLRTIENDIITQEELERIEKMQLYAEIYKDIGYCLVCARMEGRPSKLHFDSPIEIINERKDESISTTRIADCDHCGIVHFKCQNCTYVNAIWRNEYDKRKECEGCGLSYFIDTSKNQKCNSKGFEFRIISD